MDLWGTYRPPLLTLKTLRCNDTTTAQQNIIQHLTERQGQDLPHSKSGCLHSVSHSDIFREMPLWHVNAAARFGKNTKLWIQHCNTPMHHLTPIPLAMTFSLCTRQQNLHDAFKMITTKSSYVKSNLSHNSLFLMNCIWFLYMWRTVLSLNDWTSPQSGSQHPPMHTPSPHHESLVCTVQCVRENAISFAHCFDSTCCNLI